MANGRQGIPGTPGAEGAPGREGAAGREGTTGQRGTRGVQGEAGAAGAAGPAGAPADVSLIRRFAWARWVFGVIVAIAVAVLISSYVGRDREITGCKKLGSHSASACEKAYPPLVPFIK